MAAESSFRDLEGQDGYSKTKWMHAIKFKLGFLVDTSRTSSISKVPNKLREVNENAYYPRVVSIGPYHSPTITSSFVRQTSVRKLDQLRSMENDKWRYILPLLHQKPINNYDQLQEMEDHKWSYMLYLLERTQDPANILDRCGESILHREDDVRASYATDIKLETHELAEIMLVDGCFILELFLRHKYQQDVTGRDPIFHDTSMVPALWQDLALLENQIPFFILEELFHIVVGPLWQENGQCLASSVTELALIFFSPVLNLTTEAIQSKCSQLADKTPSHILDLLHTFYLHTSPKDASKRWASQGFKLCVTKLLESGIQFEKGQEGRLLDIGFNERVIKIPPLCIDETTVSLLRNLIAFEQCGSLGSTQHISSYAILMSSLIRSRADVELLHEKGIITNNLGGVENSLNFIKNISKRVVTKDFYFGMLCEEVNQDQISKLDWRRQKAILRVRGHAYIVATKNKGVKYMTDLRKDYCSNPWRIMSVIAAVVLLILTAIQTYYSARPYLRLHY